MQENQGAGRFDEKEKFEMLMASSPDCIKLFNLENKIEYLSPGGLAEHNFKSMDEAIGFDWTETIVPEQREAIREKIKESIAEKKMVSLDVKHLPEFANREWCHLIINPVFDEKQEVKYFVGISRDISDRKRAEGEMQEYSAEQDRMNKAMVNRELKMIELKKENERLRQELESLKK